MVALSIAVILLAIAVIIQGRTMLKILKILEDLWEVTNGKVSKVQRAQGDI